MQNVIDFIFSEIIRQKKSQKAVARLAKIPLHQLQGWRQRPTSTFHAIGQVIKTRGYKIEITKREQQK